MKDWKAAIARVLNAIVRQRCRVHLMRNLLALTPDARVAGVASAFIATAFAQEDA